MGYPSPAFVVGGVRRSLHTFRASQLLKRVPLTRLVERNKDRRRSCVPSVENLLRKELKLLEQIPSSSRAFATVVINSAGDQVERHEGSKELKLAEDSQLAARHQSQGATALGQYDRWAPYNSANPSSSKAVFNRKDFPDKTLLQKGNVFYEELVAYKKHFDHLLRAEQEDAESRVIERLAHWSRERLVAEGYTLEDLSAFKYIKHGEMHDGCTYSFVPPVGGSLGVNLLLRKSQVSVVLSSKTPLDYLDPKTERIATRQGTVVYSSPQEIRVKLSESKGRLPAHLKWRLDPYVSDINRQRMLEAIEALNYNPAEMDDKSSHTEEYELYGTYLRDIILDDWCNDSQSRPHNPNTESTDIIQPPQSGLFISDERIRDWVRRHSLPTPKDKDDDPKLSLNTSQIHAIAQMIGERFSLVQGPPGTGKTRTIIETVRLLKAHFKVPHPLLICTYTNAAVDNLVEGLADVGLRPVRVSSEGSVKDGLSQWSLETQMQKFPEWKELVSLKQKRQNTWERLSNLKNYDPAAGPLHTALSLLKEEIRTLEASLQYHCLRSADVICTTCLTADSWKLRNMDFPVVFLDEASMSTEPASLIPLMRGSQHVALIGDHKQLPPVITSTDAQLGGLSRSLFQRLIEKQTIPSVMLNTQYRMHPSISAFPSKEFYDAALKDGTVSAEGTVEATFEPPKSRHLSRRKSKLTEQVSPVLFIHHEHWEEAKDRSRVNIHDQRIVIAILEDLFLSNPEMQGKSIGIIAPYVAQIRMLETALKTDPEWEDHFREKLGAKRALQLKEIEVKTVDGFEGREKEVIIFSTVRNNSFGKIGFLADRRRMNVALTRAKRALFVIGNMTTLSQGRYGDNREEVEKDVAKMMVQASGDEWKKFIQFVLAEELFTEYDRLPEYRSAEEILAFEQAAIDPLF